MVDALYFQRVGGQFLFPMIVGGQFLSKYAVGGRWSVVGGRWSVVGGLWPVVWYYVNKKTPVHWYSYI